MENAKISNLYDLDETIAKEYLEQFTYPWEALKGISEFIKKLGPTLDPEKFEKRGEDIWVAKSAKVAPNFFNPVSIFSSPSFTTTSVLSDFTFDVIEPAPICDL